MLSAKQETIMGQAKNEMMRIEGLEAQGADVLVIAGALKRCDMHEHILIIQDDSDALKSAYAIGTNMVKAGEVDGTREEFMDSIKSAYENGVDECYTCAKLMAE
jgi:hypothetical protein